MHLPLHFAHQACVQAVLARHPHTLPLGQEDRPLEKPAEDLEMEGVESLGECSSWWEGLNWGSSNNLDVLMTLKS